MKIAFVGKGGSGKTTLSALFSRYLADQNQPVLAIDADINQHLAVAVGMTVAEAARIPALGLETKRIKDYLRGTNARIGSAAVMTKTTPPGSGSKLLNVTDHNPIYDHFERSAGSVRLMATGPFDEADLGVACYHSKVGAVELILSHLIDHEDEYVVVDMTAGADSFASGLFTKFDVTFLVAEPTLKGVSVYRQYCDYAKDFDTNVKVIGNKVENADDLAFLQEHVGEDLIATFGRSDYVKSMEKGRFLPFDELESDNLEALKQIKAVIDGVAKDWDKFYRQTVEFHIKNALSWANEEVGEDLRQQVDPAFSLTDTIHHLV